MSLNHKFIMGYEPNHSCFLCGIKHDLIDVSHLYKTTDPIFKSELDDNEKRFFCSLCVEFNGCMYYRNKSDQVTMENFSKGIRWLYEKLSENGHIK